jgi:GNAT superfamily N-acetyltransferase
VTSARARSSTAADVRALDAEGYRAAIPELAALIVDAVAGGAGITFLRDVTPEKAAAWWRSLEPDVASGRTTPFVAVDEDGRVVGSTLLVRSIYENSPHRAEIGKVIVLRSHRRRGLAAALMTAAEEHARGDGRWLLVLDTVEGSAAEALYHSLGWHETGVVPNFAMNPHGVPQPATFFWKDLR